MPAPGCPGDKTGTMGESQAQMQGSCGQRTSHGVTSPEDAWNFPYKRTRSPALSWVAGEGFWGDSAHCPPPPTKGSAGWSARASEEPQPGLEP